MPEQLAIAADIQLGLEVPSIEAFATGWAAEGDDVPIEQLGIAEQVDIGGQFSLGSGIDDGFLRQPFQGGAGFDT